SSGHLSTGGSEPAIFQETATSQFAHELARIGEMRAVGGSGRQAIGVHAAVEPIGKPQDDPLRIAESGSLQKPAQYRAERLFGLPNELGAKRCSHDSIKARPAGPGLEGTGCLNQMAESAVSSC